MPAITPKKMSSPGISDSLEALERDYLEGDLTKKGYCRKKWELLEKHADQPTTFLVNTLKQRPITADFTEADLYNAMIPLLHMVASEVSRKVKVSNVANHTNGNVVTRESPDSASSALAAVSNGNGSGSSSVVDTKQDEAQSADDSDGNGTNEDGVVEEMEVDEKADDLPVKTSETRILPKTIREKPGARSSKTIKSEKPESPQLPKETKNGKSSSQHTPKLQVKFNWGCAGKSSQPLKPSVSNAALKSGSPGPSEEPKNSAAGSSGKAQPNLPAGPSRLRKKESDEKKPLNGSNENDKDLTEKSPCSVVLKKRKTRMDEDGYLIVDDVESTAAASKKIKVEVEIDSDEKGSLSPRSQTEPEKRQSKSRQVKKEEDDSDEDGDQKRSGKRRTIQVKDEVDSDEEYGKKSVRRRSVKSKTEKKPGKAVKVKDEKKDGVERCRICRQNLNSPDLRRFEGPPNMAVEEFIAVTDEKLTDAYGDEGPPQNKLTQFSVYDEDGHLCPLDGGVLERNLPLYASGYLKPVYDDDPSAEDAVPTKEIGPIVQWWIGGYDGGEKALIGISTEYGEYYLMEPVEAYAPHMIVLLEKIYLGKLVIEFLTKEEDASYEDLLNHIQTTVPPPGIPKITEDSLMRHAQFVCDQVVSYDEAGYSSDEDDESEIDWRLLTAAPCMRTLKSLAGATTKKREHKAYRISEKSKTAPKPKDGVTMATTTALVRDIFDSLFSGQLAVDEKKLQGCKKLRCGVCEACQRPDCGSCTNCKDMVKFGGSGKCKQGCIRRKCPNMTEKEAVIESDEDEDADVDVVAVDASKTKSKSRGLVITKKKVDWIGEPIHVDDNGKKYFQSATVGNDKVSVGDFISCEANDKNSPVVIGRIQFLWEKASQFNKKYMHLYWFSRGCETILGETADPQEIFLVDECENTLLNGVISKVVVHKKEISPTWAENGGKEVEHDSYGPSEFFYSKKYDPLRGRFETIPTEEEPDEDSKYKHCPACIATKRQTEFEKPCLSEPIDETKGKTEFAVLTWRGEEYFKGQCVYLEADTFKFKKTKASKTSKKEEDVISSLDEDKYPEKYRKADGDRRPSNENNPDPFCIGLIHSIHANAGGLVDAKDVTLRVFKFYRPENTRGIVSDLNQLDLTKLYASVSDDLAIDFSRVVGKCYVVYDQHFPDPADATSWSTEGPDRFYFSDAYDPEEQKTVDPPRVFLSLGYVGKGGGKRTKKSSKHTVTIPSFANIERPLRCLDVFAGCGGLSDGLHQAGVAESKWAIEKIEEAASAFRVNNPGTTVFTDDCNHFMKAVINGETRNNKGQKYPQKGDVEMLVGGPPCQGFSGMNRFNWRETAMFRNSLVVSYLSFCDYYRPKYFILENVRNFVSFKKSMVLKLTLRCLIQMGYQVAVGILQAGHYGVPQTRRRAIILAAAPGEVLPQYPEPLHVFNPKTGGLSIVIDNKKIVSGCRYTESAPLRTITVYDAMSDLPEIRNGDHKVERPYGDPDYLTHFQKMVRDKTAGAMLRDHICKDFSALVIERIRKIPTTKNADWRDLPNIEVTLPDGTVCRKLMYTHNDEKNGISSTGALRGVCSCATGDKCDPVDRQFNTLIPWCLPHTGNRHNNWAGLYGRLQWGEFFSTTVTNPEPMGKQGRVLHPTQDRCVSVRECARSQGFKDSYRFYGSPLDKHRQVGNAVPPPMGRAIGLEIKKCLAVNRKNDITETET